MKISQEQKAQNREAILQAAVDQVIEKGVKGATMRSIARGAGVGDATVYNYFPTKEAIFYAYYEERIKESVARLEAMEGLDEYSLQERLQGLFEELLGSFLADREFLEQTFRSVFFAMPPNHRELRPIQNHFFDAVGRAFTAAQDTGELEEMILTDLVVRLFWDYFNGIVVYWLGDASEQFSATSVLIDKTMALACSVLKAGVVNKVIDVVGFLFRNHVLAHLDGYGAGINAFQEIHKAFMEGGHERSGTPR